MADEAGISRMYGGIHYRSDIEGGRAHGLRIGKHLMSFVSGDRAQRESAIVPALPRRTA